MAKPLQPFRRNSALRRPKNYNFSSLSHGSPVVSLSDCKLNVKLSRVNNLIFRLCKQPKPTLWSKKAHEEADVKKIKQTEAMCYFCAVNRMFLLSFASADFLTLYMRTIGYHKTKAMTQL